MITKSEHMIRQVLDSHPQLPRFTQGMPGTMTPLLAPKKGLHFKTRAFLRKPEKASPEMSIRMVLKTSFKKKIDQSEEMGRLLRS